MTHATFNMNHKCRVTLTAAGVALHEKYRERLSRNGVPAKYMPPSHKPGDVIEEQLWHLMNIYGPGMVMGMENPFKDCIIELPGQHVVFKPFEGD